jgi:predicted ATPase/DNA-binding SARP family transcriptional activator
MAVLATGRLPVRLTPLVGRDSELGAIERALGGCRLLTLTGPGGAGKTRLALATASALAETADVAWAELAAVDKPEIVAPTVAGRLGVPEAPGRDAGSLTAAHIGERRVLVVLDNCEHLTDAVAELAGYLLAECPAITILATSRETLGLEGERSWPVPPLAVADAVRLFEERARQVTPSFAVTGAERDTVAGICAKVDCLPLAIELAAARTRILSVRQLAERLDDVFGVLAGGARTAPPRHQALRATLDWSHDLLAAEERAIFRRLAVFSGGCTLAAAEHVTAFAGIAPGQVLDLLTRLADKSLLHVEHERHHLLATIREYAREQLVTAGELERAHCLHLRYYTDLSERSGFLLEHAAAENLEEILDQCDLERANLRAASDFARASGDAVAALRIAGQLGQYAYLRGHYREVREWMDHAVAAGPSAPAGLRARALLGSGRLAHLQCDYGPAVRRLDAALWLYRDLDDTTGIAACLQELGSVARERGKYAESARLHADSLELARAAGDERAEARARSYLGFVAWLEGDFDLAVTSCTAALGMSRSLRDVEGMAWSLLSLGVATRYLGDLTRADTLLRESLALAESIGFREVIGWCQEQLGLLAPPERAADMLASSFRTHSDLRDRWRMSSLLEDLASVELASGHEAGWAARLLGAAHALREEIGTVIPQCERPQHDISMAAVLDTLGHAAFEAAWLEGVGASDLAELVAEPGERTRTPFDVKDGERTSSAAEESPAARGVLRVRALGAATVEVGGVAVTTADWGYAKPRELLFLLVTSPPLSRGQIGAALWPDLSRQQLGNALHTALRELRRALGDAAWVKYSGGRYSVNRSRAVDCDVDTFEAALAAASTARPHEAALPDLQRATTAYRGDFLAGASFGEWASVRRDELRRRFESALLASGRLHAAAGRHQVAAAAFRRAIEHEPLNETAHRELMTSWSALGEMARAARHYEELSVLLRSTVGVAPSPETTAVYERLTTRS